jgi:hypothetical protein
VDRHPGQRTRRSGSNRRPSACRQNVSVPRIHKPPATARHFHRGEQRRKRRIRIESGPTQKVQPTARTKKAYKRRPFRNRLMRFEPTTFSMASRTRGRGVGHYVPANRRFLAPLRAARESGISRRFTAV